MASSVAFSIIIVFFLVGSAFFSASETALFSIPRERIPFFQQSAKRRRQWVFQLLRNGQRTLLLILLGNLFVNITLTGLIYTLIGIIVPGGTALLTMVSATLVIVIFGEMLPKNIALKHNEKIATLIAPLLLGLSYFFSPLLLLIQHINNFFLAHLKRRLRRPSPFVTVDELKSGVIASRNSGAISSEEQDIIVGLLEHGTRPVRQFMQHRSGLVLVADNSSVAHTLIKLKELKQLMVLVYNKENTGQVIGQVHLAALLRANGNESVKKLIKPILWVSDTMEVAEVIGVLFAKNCSNAGVIDEHGSFSGILTLSAGIRSILAPFFNSEIKKEGVGSTRARLFSGITELDTIQNWIPPSLEKIAQEVRTLNGLLTNYLGYIPQTGDKFAIDGWNFYIIKASPNKIESALIKKRKNYEY